MDTPKIWASLHPFYEGGSVLGRTMANRAFIRAFLHMVDVTSFFDAFHFFLPAQEDVRGLEAQLKKEYPALQAEGRFLVRLWHTLPEALSQTDYYCFHLSDPFVSYAELIRLRNQYSRVIFPVTATTHSLSYKEYGESFLRHMWAGISKRDAVVATSRCGQSVVTNFYQMLRRNYGFAEEGFPAPAVPIIPLGVALADFPGPEDRVDAVVPADLAIKDAEVGGSLRSKTRARLGFRDEELVFLTLARISYQSKMDLLPLLQAFKRAEAEGLASRSYHFLLAGWEHEEDTFGSDVELFCRNLDISCTIVRRPDDAERKALYAAADIFVSPVDNMQETFGLTMLEAAASSLPIIASDFDGYKDLVRHGRTGLLIPTLGPVDTSDTNVRSGMAASEYHLRLAQQCVVDVKTLGRALARLGTDSALGCAMGEEGRKHALEYSWDKIITRYMALWSDLNAVPLSREEEQRLRHSAYPCQIDYADLFSGYYSATLDAPDQQTRLLRWSKRGEAVYRGKDFPVFYTVIKSEIPKEELKKLLLAARRPLPLRDARTVAERLREEYKTLGDRDFLLLWALKHDLLEFVE